MKATELCTKLADYYEADPSRWLQDMLYSSRPDVQCCLLGGIMLMSEDMQVRHLDNSHSRPEVREAIELLQEFIPAKHKVQGSPWGSVIEWNNYWATTPIDIIGALRQAARKGEAA